MLWQTRGFSRRLLLLGSTSLVLICSLAPISQAEVQSGDNNAELNRKIVELTALVQKLSARVEDLEAKLKPVPKTGEAMATQAAPGSAAVAAVPAPTPAPASTDAPVLTTSLLLDGYYGYNFNRPIGRTNLLRAYDVSSNAFSLNQAAVVFEKAASAEAGKRFGLRVDLQFGQATETLQGNANNELRPQVWRNIFQAYGTYIFPVGKGLTVDFGKWASSIGLEGNYTKDQINYSRSYWFNALPFYHVGARVSYAFTEKVTFNYWLTNGTQQTEPFNNFKDQLFGLTLQPRKNLSLIANYYIGQEHPDVVYMPTSEGAGLPTQQGQPFMPIPNAPKGKLHIFDTYATWLATPKLTFALEGDYVIQRLRTTSAPTWLMGGAGYARYQYHPRMAMAGRVEYLSDHGGMFTGQSQVVRETTLTFEQRLAEGFQVREEWRRDFSNHPYFLTDTLGIVKKHQNTATVGLVWWFGGKTGIW